MLYFQNSKNHTGEIKYSNIANNGPSQQKNLKSLLTKYYQHKGVSDFRALGLIIFWWKLISHFFALGLNITSWDYMKRTDNFLYTKWGKDIFDYRKKSFYEKKSRTIIGCMNNLPCPVEKCWIYLLYINIYVWCIKLFF